MANNMHYSKYKYAFRFVLLGIALLCLLIYVIAWLTTGIEVINYYNFCADKNNYKETERVIDFGADGSIFFKDTRGITGEPYVKNNLLDENAEIAKSRGISVDLESGDKVTVILAPAEFSEHSVVGIKSGGKIYLDFEEGYENWMKVPEYSKDYFFNGAPIPLITGLIFLVPFIILQILSAAYKKKNKQSIEATPVPAQTPEGVVKNKPIKFWHFIVFPMLIGIMFIFNNITLMLYVPAATDTYYFSDKASYVDVLCEVVEENGYRYLNALENSSSYSYTGFHLSEENLYIAAGRGMSAEILAGDTVIVTCAPGNVQVHSRIAAIKKGNKVYLYFNEGYVNILNDCQTQKTTAFLWIFIPLGIFIICIGLFVFFVIKYKRLKKIQSVRLPNIQP